MWWVLTINMEKYDFFTHGALKLPIGYRFCPTDEEVLLHYLKKRVHAMPLPASVIPEFDVFQTDPWDLPGLFKVSCFLFMYIYGFKALLICYIGYCSKR